MRVDEELMDIGVLGEGFSLTQLWCMREQLAELREALECLKEKAIYNQSIREAVKMEKSFFS